MIQAYSGTKGTRLASRASWSGKEEPYPCSQAWPHDCFVQCGGDGVVLPRNTITTILEGGDMTPIAKCIAGSLPTTYRTAFFEAFPKFPDTFIRGEGATIEEAEMSCWRKYVKITSCPKHEFERRGRTDGYCYCKHCGLGGMFMEKVDS
jgi:hypothetical protein